MKEKEEIRLDLGSSLWIIFRILAEEMVIPKEVEESIHRQAAIVYDRIN